MKGFNLRLLPLRPSRMKGFNPQAVSQQCPREEAKAALLFEPAGRVGGRSP